jgi:large subunit ribosomal protein L24
VAEKIITGDEVLVIGGKDKGARGRVRRNLPRVDRVVVEGVNRAKKHQKAISGVRQAGIIEMEVPLHVSNVMLICPSCNKPTRAGFRREESGEKVRYCKKCLSVIQHPRA